MAKILVEFNNYFGALPKGTECDHIVLLRGSNEAGDGDEPTIDLMVWLVLKRLQPVVQIFARLALQESGSLEFVSPAFPFLVEIPAKAARTDWRQEEAHLCTSDELASNMAALRGTWEIRPVLWEEVNDNRSLRVARVVGFGDPHVATKKPARTIIQSENLCDLLDGLRSERKAVGRLSSTESRPTPPPAPVDDELTDVLGDVDAEMMDGMPNDFVDDVRDELEEAMGVVAPPDDAGIILDVSSECAAEPSVSDVGSKTMDATGEGDSDMDTETIQALLASVGVDACGRPVESASSSGGGGGSHGGLPSPELVASAVISETGHISCPRKPWCEFTNIGRITTWPDHLPMEKRNVSIKCHMHHNCSSPVRTRKHFSDQELLTWLFTGTCEPILSDGRSKDLAREHKAKWATTIDTLRAHSKS